MPHLIYGEGLHLFCKAALQSAIRKRDNSCSFKGEQMSSQGLFKLNGLIRLGRTRFQIRPGLIAIPSFTESARVAAIGRPLYEMLHISGRHWPTALLDDIHIKDASVTACDNIDHLVLHLEGPERRLDLETLAAA